MTSRALIRWTRIRRARLLGRAAVAPTRVRPRGRTHHLHAG